MINSKARDLKDKDSKVKSGHRGIEIEDDDDTKHKDKTRKVSNPSQHPAFKLNENESYHDLFTGRDKARTCPNFNKKSMCRKWHIQGFCFNTCNMAESHVPQEKLSAKQKEEFKNWMVDCRKGKRGSSA